MLVFHWLFERDKLISYEKPVYREQQQSDFLNRTENSSLLGKKKEQASPL